MLNIPTYELDVTDSDVFDAFDYTIPGLKETKKYLDANDYKNAKKALIKYFETRNNVKYFYDYRKGFEKIDTDTNPYFFQSALGLNGELKPFMIYVADRMLENTYVLPGKGRLEVYLGDNLEQMIHFNFLEDQGKRHRSSLDQFVRGQFFESLAVAYHETKDEKYLKRFEIMLNKFFETYPLRIVDTRANANRFQFDEDRDVMSTGWLTLVHISLFYTRLPYDIDPELSFEIIKRIWFQGIQFRRFDNDTYRAYNHHLFERGLTPFSLSVLLPEIPSFRFMQKKAIKIVRRHVKEDFNKAGGYSEHSISYWSGAALGEMLMRGLVLARLNGIQLLDKTGFERIDKSFSLLALLSKPGSFYPNIGDNKGPEIDPILRNGILSTDNKDCKSVLKGRHGSVDKSELPPYDYANDLAGFVITRSGYRENDSYLVMSCKKNCGYTGHNHMDMLSVIYVLKGKEIVGEPYSGKLYHSIRHKSPQRGFMYNMSSHNTVLCYGKPIVDDMYYSNKWGVYRPDSPIRQSLSTSEGFFAEAYHSAYTFCLHRRSIYFNREYGLVVHDKVERGNRYEDLHIQRWHLGEGSKVEKIKDNALIITVDNIEVLLLAKEARNIKIFTNDLLYPEIIKDKNDLYPSLDISFQAPDRLVADNAPADLSTLFLDVSGKKEKALINLDRIEALLDEGKPEEVISSIRKMHELLN